MRRSGLIAALTAIGACGLLASLASVHGPSSSAAANTAATAHAAPPTAHAAPALPPPPARAVSACRTRINSTSSRITLRVGEHGFIRLLLRPEWSAPSAEYAKLVAAAAQPTSQVYRLEPGFLIQGRLAAPGVPPNRDKTRAPKLMERGEVGWAGGSAGPDYFIYLGLGPATWLGNPHEGTIFAEVADEESMEVANNVSLLPVPPTPPGQMHTLKSPVKVTASLGHATHDDEHGGSGFAAPASVASLARGMQVLTTAPTSVASLADGIPTLDVLKVAGAVLDTAAAECAAGCHALPHTELHGDVVKWGEQHLVESAAACCAACEEHAAANGAPGKKACNVWVWCSNAERCGKRHRQCWLKHAKQLWADEALVIGTSEAWTAGTMQPAPADHPSGAGRAVPSAAAADLALEIALVPQQPAVEAPAAAGVVVVTPAASKGSAKGGINDGAVLRSVRFKVREAAPRSAARLRALAQAAATPEASREWADATAAHAMPMAACAGGGVRADSDGDAPARPSPFGILTGGQPTPASWGLASQPDGFGAHARWPRGAAVLHGSIGAAWAGSGPRAVRVPVEAHPVPVRRGSIGWATLGADGPDFFVALADHPHLGVAHTVVGEVAKEDLALIDELADELARGQWRLPARVRMRPL